ncbi:MAG TPA: group 1 truncated hemoglobin [Mariprofundaceae bacterium]|nr:group 1 truncated hemoglobin [Mariprofundaceae bacterium]
MNFFTIILPLILLAVLLVLLAQIGLQAIAHPPAKSSASGGGGQSAGEKTLYEILGGDAAIDAAVDIFYRRVLADAYISTFFEGVDMDRQAAKQKSFLTMVFGGPNNYTGKDMREGHKHLVQRGLDGSHFDHVLAHLRSTLAELGVGEDLIQTVIDTAESTRADVLNR